MNLFARFGRGSQPEDDSVAKLRDSLPLVNSFVDVAVGSARRESLAVNDISRTAIVTRCPTGLVAGAQADFVYANSAGRFRFLTVCAKIEDGNAYFDLPCSIKTLELFTARGAARVSRVIPVQWRYAPDSVGYGEFLLGSLMDLSHGGASLVVDRTLKTGTAVEVRFQLVPTDTTFTQLCEVVRAAKIGTSAKNAVGIRFIAMDPDNGRTLVNYLRELQKARRDRGVI